MFVTHSNLPLHNILITALYTLILLTLKIYFLYAFYYYLIILIVPSLFLSHLLCKKKTFISLVCTVAFKLYPLLTQPGVLLYSSKHPGTGKIGSHVTTVIVITSKDSPAVY